jgi:hypothetical protein
VTPIEHLEEHVWEHPENYGGFSPDGDYLVLARTRNSSTIDESNWTVALRSLRALETTLPEFAPEEEERTSWGDISPRNGWVYTWGARHWACGYIDHLMVRNDAPDEIKEAAGEIICSIASYPILDDDHHSELECEQIYEYWRGESIKYRIQLCAEAGDSIFAARRDNDIPEATFDRIRDTWT